VCVHVHYLHSHRIHVPSNPDRYVVCRSFVLCAGIFASTSFWDTRLRRFSFGRLMFCTCKMTSRPVKSSRAGPMRSFAGGSTCGLLWWLPAFIHHHAWLGERISSPSWSSQSSDGEAGWILPLVPLFLGRHIGGSLAFHALGRTSPKGMSLFDRARCDSRASPPFWSMNARFLGEWGARSHVRGAGPISLSLVASTNTGIHGFS